jgi:hypothetical protein
MGSRLLLLISNLHTMLSLSYAQIGRMVWYTKPEVVNEILQQQQPPQESDLQMISGYYARFLISYPNGNLKENVENRRLFIAAMFHLYQPEVFTAKNIYVNRRLGKEISVQVGVQNYTVSKILREVVIMEKAYNEFREQVQKVLGEI